MKKGLFLGIFFVSMLVFQGNSFASEGGAKILWNKKTTEKAIALTVDDCSVRSNVEKMLEIAERHGIKLTFFPTGKNVLVQNELWKKVHSLGHQIELHTQSHRSMVASEDVQAGEIIQNILSVRKVLGNELKFSFLRPPFGAGIEGENRLRMLKAIEKANECNGKPIDIAMWSIDLMFIGGKLSSSEEIRDHFMSNISPGNIFLFHARSEDITHFEEMVVHAKQKGYEMVSMSELFSKESKPDEPIQEEPSIPEKIFKSKTLLADSGLAEIFSEREVEQTSGLKGSFMRKTKMLTRKSS